MEKMIDEYLSAIKATEIVKQSVDKCLKDVENLYNIKFDDIFINTKLDAGAIVYSSLWLFSDSAVTECKSFLNQKNYDLAIFKNNIEYVETKMKEYSVDGEASDNSSVLVSASFCQGDISLDLSAIGSNCKFLVEMSKKYIYPNMINK